MDELKSLQPSLNLSDKLSTDIKYADDTTLIAAVFDKSKISTSQLEASCKKWGMKFNPLKCKVISTDNGIIVIDNAAFEKVSEFTFLCSVVPGSTSDVKRRIRLAARAFGCLKDAIWSRKNISSITLKVCLYQTLILPLSFMPAGRGP